MLIILTILSIGSFLTHFVKPELYPIASNSSIHRLYLSRSTMHSHNIKPVRLNNGMSGSSSISNVSKSYPMNSSPTVKISNKGSGSEAPMSTILNPRHFNPKTRIVKTQKFPMNQKSKILRSKAAPMS